MTSDKTIGPNKIYAPIGNPGGLTTTGLINVLYGDWHVATINMSTSGFNSAAASELWALNSTQ
jgi:prepilin-type processing-associated H-X9-DG protein